ncbi:predicted protein [Uncinocarpus reesii 1704]|uniref:AB hydrolase-1 domain-containing protein n=1 Tax=Uncinocarpus reesii (strain UAMH 1704) TaxID=336963 RepID=C4JZS5_UNCRE|nr:uncharacterized protein UREG_07676 [Uncinocarpus reesii 1704]EEP82811.1 predicted protein [Uncinocarpus reesii 1704]
MELDFNPNLRLHSTFYDVPGYESNFHVLTSPSPPPFLRRDTSPAMSSSFEPEQTLQSEAYYGRLPVVLVHGMVVASSYMHDLGRHLAPWFRVFIPDLPGFGRSTNAMPKTGENSKVSIVQLAQGLHDWMDAAGIQKAHLISNSLGCQLLAEFTRRWPERVGRLVLQGPTMDGSHQPIRKTLRALVTNSRNEPLSMSRIMIRDYWRAGWRRALALFREAADYRISDVLPNLKNPTLLLSGELDPVAPCSWVAELAETVPNAVHYVLTKAAHTANYSATEKMSRIVCRYLLIQDDDEIRRAGGEILEQVTRINHTREAAAKQKSRLLCLQSASVLLSAALFATRKEFVGSWPFLVGLLSIESTILYKLYRIRPSLSLSRSDHLDPVYVKLPGIADFDSASSMLRAIGRYLHFRDFPQLGVPTPLAGAMPLVNKLPPSLRNTVYSTVGANEAVAEHDVASTFDAESVTHSVVAHFPAHRKYPAVAIGSTNGALTHLYAAMGIPWLPQTLLMPVKRSRDASIHQGLLDMTAEMEWGRSAGQTLLEGNPNMIEVYHMADPNQDQLMIQRMAYFRLKFIKMTQAYRRFLLDALEPNNGTIVLVRCGLKWPSSTKVAERQYFQSGALGGLSAEGFVRSPTVVNEFVESQKSTSTKLRETVLGMERRTDWNAPPPSSEEEISEAEWGYAEALTDDIVAFANEHGFQIKYLDYDHPEDASPLVADMYRQWRTSAQLHRGHPTADSILVENFVVLEPWLAMRYNLIPFWTVFPVKPSLERLQRYLNRCSEAGRGFKDGFLFLFCSGVHSIELMGVEAWKEVLRRHFASSSASSKDMDAVVEKKPSPLLLGIDKNKFPKDFGFPALYQGQLAEAVGEEGQYVMPPSLALVVLERFMMRNAENYGMCYKADND